MKGINQKYPELPRVGDIGHITGNRDWAEFAVECDLGWDSKGERREKLRDGGGASFQNEVGITGNIMVTWDFSGINFKDKGNVTVILTITTRVVSG
ncbi:hypothetical protein T4D_4135 [Trichinella pseudospiralis]|uniref:Uncharacterized protein n=1 Tax=Trichinella pseudospiralis TaxID=6337 RepID=A0A0V1FDH0_TRIPS|nr:hypothetical protein T4D_4135 [Trichinella pseudospiralis]